MNSEDLFSLVLSLITVIVSLATFSGRRESQEEAQPGHTADYVKAASAGLEGVRSWAEAETVLKELGSIKISEYAAKPELAKDVNAIIDHLIALAPPPRPPGDP